MPYRRFTACLLALAACTSSSSDGARPENDGGPSPAPGSCYDKQPRYAAFTKGIGCTDVEGREGRWIGTSLFPDAPVKEFACAWRWDAAGADADVDALRGLPIEALTELRQAWPTCVRTTVPVDIRLYVEPEAGSAPTGVSGCDVCGRVYDESVYFILPSNLYGERRFFVDAPDGRETTWVVTPPADRPQSFVVHVGAGYGSGKVTLVP